MGSGKTFSNRDRKSCHADDFPSEGSFFRLENAEFDERQQIYLHEFSVESAQAVEAHRKVLTHEAAGEIHRRDSVSLGYDANSGI